MKKIRLFHINGCPYCVQGEKVLRELVAENPEYGKVEIERIEENEHPEIIADYDYRVVPCMFIDDRKVYESHLFESASEAKKKIKAALDLAISEQ